MTPLSSTLASKENPITQPASGERPLPEALKSALMERKGDQQGAPGESDAPLASDITATLPTVFRMVSIEHDRYPMGTLSWATLFHDSASLDVCWQSKGADQRLSSGCLVRAHWIPNEKHTCGARLIRRLVLLSEPCGTIDLFQTVPHDWVQDRGLLQRASALWNQLPLAFRNLFNAMLWEGSRFQRFVMGPSSLENHHIGHNGNFRHSIEVAELALSLAATNKLASAPIVLLSALIHDAAKADEYRFDEERNCYVMSDQGTLIGHRDRLQHWIAAAIARHRIVLRELDRLGLLHALTAATGAPPHLGLREPRSIEATILSAADRVSGQTDFYARLSRGEPWFGDYHKHLHGRPFVAGPVKLEACC